MKNLLACIAASIFLHSQPAFAQDQKLPTGFRGEFLRQLADVEKKLIDLEQAIPQEKFTWRPGEAVRSIAEVYLHIAGDNYYLMEVVEMNTPADTGVGTGDSLEHSTVDKSRIAEILRQSFTRVQVGVMKLSEADLGNPVTLFGRQTTVRDALLALALHQHEHLGQSIAYARSNGIVPPWSAARMARQKKN